MHGNRDFMIGQALAERCFFNIIHDPHKITIQNRDVLLMQDDTTRIALADWHETGSYLRIKDNADFKLQTYR